MNSNFQRSENEYLVSGIKSTKEDWLRGVTEEKRMPEANQKIGKILMYLNFYSTYWALGHTEAGLQL